jgi:hypothetical protein
LQPPCHGAAGLTIRTIFRLNSFSWKVWTLTPRNQIARRFSSTASSFRSDLIITKQRLFTPARLLIEARPTLAAANVHHRTEAFRKIMSETIELL